MALALGGRQLPRIPGLSLLAQSRCRASTSETFKLLAAPRSSLGRFAANAGWLAVQAVAHNLVGWTGRIALNELVATTKTLRRRFFSLAGGITRKARGLTLHLTQGWPWATRFTGALARLRSLPLPSWRRHWHLTRPKDYPLPGRPAPGWTKRASLRHLLSGSRSCTTPGRRKSHSPDPAAKGRPVRFLSLVITGLSNPAASLRWIGLEKGKLTLTEQGGGADCMAGKKPDR